MLNKPQFPQLAQSQLSSESPARTAYQIQSAGKLTPFVRAKYGLGGTGAAPSAASVTGAQVAQFGPSGDGGVKMPVIQPAQFGNNFQ